MQLALYHCTPLLTTIKTSTTCALIVVMINKALVIVLSYFYHLHPIKCIIWVHFLFNSCAKSIAWFNCAKGLGFKPAKICCWSIMLFWVSNRDHTCSCFRYLLLWFEFQLYCLQNWCWYVRKNWVHGLCSNNDGKCLLEKDYMRKHEFCCNDS